MNRLKRKLIRWLGGMTWDDFTPSQQVAILQEKVDRTRSMMCAKQLQASWPNYSQSSPELINKE